VKRLEILLTRLKLYANCWWYLPLVSLLAGLDLYVMVIPMEAIIVSSVMLSPRRWVAIATCSTLGSAVGAFSLAAIVSNFGHAWAEKFFSDSMQSQRWQDVAAFLAKYGDWALGLMSFGPLPQQPAVILVALAGMSTVTIFFSVLIGRGIKYFLFAWAATHSPKLIAQLFPQATDNKPNSR